MDMNKKNLIELRNLVGKDVMNIVLDYHRDIFESHKFYSDVVKKINWSLCGVNSFSFIDSLLTMITDLESIFNLKYYQSYGMDFGRYEDNTIAWESFSIEICFICRCEAGILNNKHSDFMKIINNFSNRRIDIQFGDYFNEFEYYAWLKIFSNQHSFNFIY